MTRAFVEAGAQVVAADISTEGLQAMEGMVGVEPLRADIASAADVGRMIATAIDAHGHIDILCNNAGVPDLFQGAAECTDEEWHRSLAVNLTGAFLASRLALRHMGPARRWRDHQYRICRVIQGRRGGRRLHGCEAWADRLDQEHRRDVRPGWHSMRRNLSRARDDGDHQAERWKACGRDD
jgi:NAD(P)-dependent dehydrogenase (short-subunit alcohol dehydrogenase family)